MINIYEVLETNKMIEQENLDVRTITMGISLLDCADTDVDRLCRATSMTRSPAWRPASSRRARTSPGNTASPS